MVNKRFKIVLQTDGKYCIHYQTNNTYANLQKYFTSLSLVDKDIENIDSANIRKMYFDRWLDWNNCKIKSHDKHVLNYYWLTEFDPINETFDDLIKRYNLVTIDDHLDQFIFLMMKQTFGGYGGWDINKAYKLHTKFLKDMFFEGFMVDFRYYIVSFNRDRFYKRVDEAISKIVNLYGNRLKL